MKIDPNGKNPLAGIILTLDHANHDLRGPDGDAFIFNILMLFHEAGITVENEKDGLILFNLLEEIGIYKPKYGTKNK